MSQNKLIYLSGAMGKVKTDYPKLWRQAVINEFRIYGDEFKFFNPIEFYNYENRCHYTEKEIMKYEFYWIKKCDVVLVNLRDIEQSIGTCDEILYAYMLGKPIIGFYCADDLDLHPWKTEQIDRIETGRDALKHAVEYIVAYYGGF